MSLTTTAPLILPNRQSVSYSDDRTYTSPVQGQTTYYSRPASSHGGPGAPSSLIDPSSPARIRSSHGYAKPGMPGTAPQTPVYAQAQDAHGYPATPVTGPSYPPSGSYYGLSGSAGGQMSPPPTGDAREQMQNFTPDGNPIVPVGISGGKMFQCRGFGECDKVFTRSEHLARHVRKHTGERPFQCHCGKAFSRLDNLRQHAATVHSDQAPLNEAMLNSLSPVHAALSARATREQRKRGEIVEVPKNAVERPRHNESFRIKEASVTPTVTAAAYPPYSDETTPTWDQQTRPRTGGYEYPFHHAIESVASAAPIETSSAGPSRRPGSAADYQMYQPGYYDGTPRPTTAEANSSESLSQLHYTYRPVSGSGIRDLPLPHNPTSQYAESEPPSSAHGLPHSPIYTAPPPPIPQPNWSSPPPPPTGYSQDHRTVYHPPPTPEGYHYPDSTSQHTPTHTYGPPPPGSAGSTYGYPASNPTYYGPNQFATPTVPSPAIATSTHVHAHHQQHPSYSGSAYGPTNPTGSPFHYPGTAGLDHDNGSGSGSGSVAGSTSGHVQPNTGLNEYQYPPPPGTIPHAPAGPLSLSGTKRRAHEIDNSTGLSTYPTTMSSPVINLRKAPRASIAMTHQPIRALQDPNPPNDDGELWFPPTTERRSSLAISALLGSPQEDHKPRPLLGGYELQVVDNTGGGGGANTAGLGHAGVGGAVGDMEEKAKALLGSAH